MVANAKAMSADQQPVVWRLCMLCFHVIGAILGVTAALALNLHEAIAIINPRWQWDVCFGLAVLLMPKAHSSDTDRSAKAQERQTDAAAVVGPEAADERQQLFKPDDARTDASTSASSGTPETDETNKTKNNNGGNRLQKFFRGFRRNRRAAKQLEQASPAAPETSAQPAASIEALFERTWSSNARQPDAPRN